MVCQSTFGEQVDIIEGAVKRGSLFRLVRTAYEGKTTLALALARKWAKQGERVLLVDADLRRACLSHQFERSGEPGLAELLSDPDNGLPVTQPDFVGGMRLLTAGAQAARSTLSITPGMVAAVIPRLEQEYDRVIIDSAPVQLVVDTRLFARNVDITLLAVRWASTSVALAAEAVHAIQDAGGHVPGVALTLVDIKRLSAEEHGNQRFYPAEPRHSRHRPAWGGFADSRHG
jgi:succinoglycan biosynthesis transport protein ExoP